MLYEKFLSVIDSKAEAEHKKKIKAGYVCGLPDGAKPTPQF